MEQWKETDTTSCPNKAYSYQMERESKQNKPESILIMLGAVVRNKAQKADRIC